MFRKKSPHRLARFEQLETRILLATDFTVLKDINALPSTQGSEIADVVATDNGFYFIANHPTHKRSMFYSDGTPAGTQVIRSSAEENQSHATAGPARAHVVSGELAVFFGDVGNNFFATDGTLAGTQVISTQFSGNVGFLDYEFINLNGTLFFSAPGAGFGRELWKTNGTAAGTSLVKDIYAGFNDSSPTDFAVFQNEVYFAARNASGDRELWKSDGTEAGTVQVADVNNAGSSSPEQLVVFNNRLYFVALTASAGRELWSFDGTTAQPVLDIFPGASSSDPQELTVAGPNLFFAADTGSAATGRELWQVDLTGVAQLVRDIRPGTDSSSPQNLTAYQNNLFFSAEDSSGNELWTSDGTSIGTNLVADISSGASSSLPADLTTSGTNLYFSATSGATGRELWVVTDPSGTPQALDLWAGSSSSDPKELADVNGKLFFSADDGMLGRELWSSTGTQANTVLFVDIYAGTGDSARGYDAERIGPRIVFPANDGVHGEELWASDGTEAGTVLLNDIRTGTTSAGIVELIPAGDQIYFSANTPGTFGIDRDLWKTDGTPTGTVLVRDGAPNIHDADSGSVFALASLQDSVIYLLQKFGNDELWITDGTSSGSMQLAQGFESYNTRDLTTANHYFFVADDGTTGNDLWVTDGTTSGTFKLMDLAPGSVGLTPRPLATNDEILLFQFYDDVLGSHVLWQSDGTTGGTKFLKTVSNSYLTAEYSNGFFYYADTDGLWAYEPVGETFLKLTSNSATWLTPQGPYLYFLSGSSLFRTDGTIAGTVPFFTGDRISSILQTGSGFPGDTQFSSVYGEHLFFRSFTESNGQEVWITDGTTAGTMLYSDITADYGSSNPYQLIESNGFLYVTGQSEDIGREWFVSQFNTAPTVVLVNPTNQIDENTDTASRIAVATIQINDDGVGDNSLSLSGVDVNTFEIDAGVLYLKAGIILDFEDQSSFTVRVEVDDRFLWAAPDGFVDYSLQLNDVNEQPTNLSFTSQAVAEDAAVGTEVGVLATTDPDANSTFTYSLVSGSGDDDNALFSISDSRLLAQGPLDFETNPTPSIRVRSTDQGGLWVERTFTVTVGDVNEPPHAIQLSNDTIPEDLAVGSAVAQIMAFDQDANSSFTFGLSAGAGDADNAAFLIEDDNLKLNAPLDFETQQVYAIRLQVTDNGGLTYEQTFTLQVTNVNEPPDNITLAPSNVDENVPLSSVVGTLDSGDPDVGDTAIYRLVSGVGDDDNSTFAIVDDQLITARSINFESKSSFSIRVRAIDAQGLSAETTLSIQVNDINEPSTSLTLSPNNVNENEPINTIVGDFNTSDPDSNDTFTYSLVAGAGDTDNASFNVVGNQLLTSEVFDFETDNQYRIRLQSTDGGGHQLVRQFAVIVNDVNDAPTGITLSNQTIDEELPAGSLVGTIATNDQDPFETFTYALVAGAGDTNNGDFQIDGNRLVTSGPLNFEVDPTREIRLRTTDSQGATFETTVTITLTDINEAPIDLALSSSEIAENSPIGSIVGSLTGTDPDLDDVLTFAFAAGAGDDDNAAFQLNNQELVTAVALDAETQSVFSIRLAAIDSAGLRFEKSVNILVRDENEAPTDLNINGNSLDENQPAGTLVGLLDSVDPDQNESFTYSLVAGLSDTDNHRFQIAGNELRSAEGFNFEQQAALQVRVRTTDAGGLFFEKGLSLAVHDRNDDPTALLLDNNRIDENAASGAELGILNTTDEDQGDTFTYRLVNGAGDANNADFSIVGNRLRTASSFNFENQPTLQIRVETTDSAGSTFTDTFSLSVNDLNEAPESLAISNTTLAENTPEPRIVGNLTSQDEDANQSFTYSLVNGTGDEDNAAFLIDGNQLLATEPLDFETQPNYSVRIRTTDQGGLFVEGIFQVLVTDENEAPHALSLSSQNVDEGLPVGEIVGTLLGQDVDAGDTLSYDLVSGSGDTDNTLFVIDGTELKTARVYDFETRDTYFVRIEVSDALGATFEQPFTLHINDVNEPPTPPQLNSNLLNENSPIGTTIGTLVVQDPDASDTVQFTLVEGDGATHNSAVEIEGNQLLSNSVFDFEQQQSLSVRIEASDAGGLTAVSKLTIQISDINEVPTSLSLDSTSIAENLLPNAVVGNLSSTDPDTGDSASYQFAQGPGDNHNALFSISGDQVLANSSFNHEFQAEYQIRLQAIDRANNALERAFTITIEDVNEPPTSLSISNSAVDEEQPAGTEVGQLFADDPDSSEQLFFELLDSVNFPDNDQFQVVGNRLQTNAVLDFETQPSFTVQVQVTDSAAHSLLNTFEIQVQNVDELRAEDVNADTFVSSIDALLVINYLNFEGGGAVPAERPRLDVNRDGFVSPIDALIVINFLNQQGAGESEPPSQSSSTARGQIAFQTVDVPWDSRQQLAPDLVDELIRSRRWPWDGPSA